MPKLKNPVGWFEIYVNDLERSQAFYEAVFGCSLTPLPDDGSFKALMFPGEPGGSGAMGAIMCHPMKKPSAEGALVYFSTDDCAVQSELAKKHGGLIYREKWSLGEGGFIAIIGDTEGNAIGLHSFS